MRRILALLACVGTATLGLAVPAGASWGGSASGTGAATAMAGLGPPILSSACNGVLLNGNVDLWWTTPPDAPLVQTYDVEISGPGGTTILHRTGLSTTVQPAGLLSLFGTYYFRVRGIAGGWIGAWSNQTHHTISKILILPVTCS